MYVYLNLIGCKCDIKDNYQNSKLVCSAIIRGEKAETLYIRLVA